MGNLFPLRVIGGGFDRYACTNDYKRLRRAATRKSLSRLAHRPVSLSFSDLSLRDKLHPGSPGIVGAVGFGSVARHHDAHQLTSEQA
jgi:hypothetical protein